MLRAAVDKKKNAQLNAERASMIHTIGRDIVAALTPVLKAIAEKPLPVGEIANAIREGIKTSMSGWKAPDSQITVRPDIQIPEIKLPSIHVPPPQVTVHVPEIKIPEIKMPNLDNIMGALRITGWDKALMDHPIPVQIRDADGKPVFLSGGSSAIMGGLGGGGTNFPREVLDLTGTSPALRVSGSLTVAGSNSSVNVIDASGDIAGSVANPLNVAIVSGAASSTIAQIGNSDGDFSAANPLPVSFSPAASQNVNVFDGQASTISSHVFGDYKGLDVNVLGIFNSAASDVVNPDGRLKVELPTGSSGLTDTELRASAVPISQVSGASWSASVTIISVSDIFSTTATSNVVTPDNRVKVDGSGVTQPVSGTVVVSGVTATVAAANVDSSGVQYSGSNPMPVNLVSQSLASSASALVDSGGVQYSGSNPIPVTIVLGSQNSTISVGPVVGDAADDGSAPVQGGGVARTANPTAVANGDVVKSTHDDLGRQITRPYQVRDLTLTAYVSVANGTETTFRAAVAGAFLDLIMLTASNNSDAACSVDIRAVTAGNIVHTLRIPANSTAGWAPAVPWPQDATGNNWTVDGPDETGRTLTFSGLFIQEV